MYESVSGFQLLFRESLVPVGREQLADISLYTNVACGVAVASYIARTKSTPPIGMLSES